MNKWNVPRLIILIILITIALISWDCKNSKNKIPPATTKEIRYDVSPFDSISIANFFTKYPKLISYKKQVIAVYAKQDYHYIWYDNKGKKETADVLNDKINNIENEGIPSPVPYKSTFDKLYLNGSLKPNLETELFLTTYYFYYTTKVIQGIDVVKTAEMGWYLPRKKLSCEDYLDSLFVHPEKNTEKKQLLGQYYKLKDVLQIYRDLEKKGGWSTISTETNFKSLQLGDSSKTILQIRNRLYLTDDITADSKSAVFDKTLLSGLLHYKNRHGFALDSIILPKHIADMNIPVGERIKTIMVNMERCRWIPTDITKAKAFIVINIPSYKLTFFKNDKIVLSSNVVVGTEMNKTVIFSGMMRYVVFNPYWNVPNSILKKEILPAIKKNKRYLANHNMEWHDGGVRQKPGPNNSLGLVKFLFPNSNNIYLHDTPSKNLFTQEKRAFSHGCIRVAKPKELAYKVLEDDANWTAEKIDAAMNGGKESWYTLKNEIPVYIGYFTSWVDAQNNVHFYNDVYNRDARLLELIVEE